jgi:hypothetical protein
MLDKFNVTTNKIAIQFTDESISFLKIIYNKPVFKFDRDFRSLKKWEFHIFDYKPILSEGKTIEKFRNKFFKLF